MAKAYSILMQKSKSGSVMKDSIKDFGMACTKVKLPDIEMKELPEYNWLDEDGEDVYYPPALRMSGYEFTIGVASKSVGSLEAMDDLLEYLTGKDGGGTEVFIYVPHDKLGRVCRLTKVTGAKRWSDGTDEVLEFDLVMKTDDPLRRVRAVGDGKGDIAMLTDR